MPAASRPDWAAGRYERTAAQLLPAAEAAVAAAAPGPGEHVVDVGCGTGNAALLAAQAGARVTGVDPAARLLAVARAEAAAHGLEATFVDGHAAALPLPNASADVVLSVFGLIFAPETEPAAAELDRVAAPDARIVLTAWVPGGGLGKMMRFAREATREARAAPPDPPPFAWQDRDALEGLLAPYGFAVDVREASLTFTGPSPEAFVDAELASHPVVVHGRPAVQAAGRAEALRERMLAALRDHNEDPGAFRSTSRYVIACARRSAR
jgi:SAM-dependent methyltransferase